MRPILLTASLVWLTTSPALASVLFPRFPYDPYALTAGPLADSGSLAPDTAPGLHFQGGDGYALAQLDYAPLVRSARISAWLGAKSLEGNEVTATAAAHAAVAAFPDEGETLGTPLTLYVHLVTRAYGGELVYQGGMSTAQLGIEAKVRPDPNQAWQTFAGPGVMPVLTTIGSRVDFLFTIQASAGGAFDSYAAMDVLFYLSYATIPPVALIPRAVVPGDGTLDGLVDAADYTLWADSYLESTTLGAMGGDFSNNGFVDAGDYTIWADHYQPESAMAGAYSLPEPSARMLVTAGLATLAGQALLRKRRGHSARRHPTPLTTSNRGNRRFRG